MELPYSSQMSPPPYDDPMQSAVLIGGQFTYRHSPSSRFFLGDLLVQLAKCERYI